MNKLVYLFELDSVRNTDKEIEIGQNALFEEIIGNGNQVVLSFNQITDSEAFLCSLKDEKAYNCMLELFKMGAIKVSRFGKYRTVSHYIQAEIEKCNESNNNCFIFSGLPVNFNDKILLDNIHYALRYSDPSILVELINKTTNADEKKRLKYILHYVKMLLVLSVEELASNPINDSTDKGGLKFIDFIHKAFTLIDGDKKHFNNAEYKSEINNLLSSAIKLLKEIENNFFSTVDKKEAERLINNRSNWVRNILNHEEQNVAHMAEAIIDLCYNYTVEESILHVSKHYENINSLEFKKDFEYRLLKYWNEFRDGTHRFYGDENIEVKQNINKLPPWETAARLIKLNRNRSKGHSEYNGFLYEKNYKQEARAWKRQITKNMLISFGAICIYIFIFVGSNYGINCLQNIIDAFANNIDFSPLTYSVMSIVLFSIISALISKLFSIPDILESINNIVLWFKDIIIVFNAHRNISRKYKQNGERYEI